MWFFIHFLLFVLQAPWSPRVGHQILSQWYYNTSHINQTVADSKERMVLAGGYGGWLEENTGGAFS